MTPRARSLSTIPVGQPLAHGSPRWKLVLRCIPWATAALFARDVWASETLNMVKYEVRGRTMEELRSEMNARGPLDAHGNRFHSYTTWNLAYGFRLEPRGQSCMVASVTPRLTVTTTLPERVQSADDSVELVQEWETFLASQKRLAEYYKLQGAGAAEEIKSRLTGMSNAAGCELLKADVAKKADATIEEFGGTPRSKRISGEGPQVGPGCEKPGYPESSRRNGEQGTVEIALLINVDGRVTETKLTRSSGHPSLDDAALESYAKCTFKRRSNTVATEAVWHPVQFTWTLQ